jgi:hypothetical protein
MGGICTNVEASEYQESLQRFCEFTGKWFQVSLFYISRMSVRTSESKGCGKVRTYSYGHTIV